MGNIIMTKIWHDEIEPFCEVEIEALGNEAWAKTRFYVLDKDLQELADSLIQFAQSVVEELAWNGNPKCKLRLLRRDLAKHIRIEATIRVDDADSHICKFYIDGIEAAPLERFAGELHGLNVGESIRVTG